MREPSVAVRETAAEHLEERHTKWAYSKPFVVLDVLWNLSFVAVAAGAGAQQDDAVDGHFKISIVKHLDSGNTMFSFIWWIIGFYWVPAGGQALSQDAPELYWLSIAGI